MVCFPLWIHNIRWIYKLIMSYVQFYFMHTKFDIVYVNVKWYPEFVSF